MPTRSSRRITRTTPGHRKPRRSWNYANLRNQEQGATVWATVDVTAGKPSLLGLPREDQFDSRNDQHGREAKRDHSHGETPATEMGADDAADNCRRCENESERRDGADF